MTGPRHLWYGDWENESSAHAEELANRRSRFDEPAETEPPSTSPEPGAPPPRESWIRRAIRTLRAHLRTLREHLRTFRARLRNMPARGRRRVRVALLAIFVTLLGATAAYAVISDSSSTKHTQTQAQNNGAQAWLGVKLANSSVSGALVSSVVPGSPAAKAGIRPGDLITQLDTEPIVASAVFVSAISGLQPGDTVDIQVQRGASQYTARVTLASPPRSP